MITIKKMIPVWIKAPIAVFLREVGKLPVHLTLSHMYYSFTQNSSCFAEKATRASRKIQQKNYAYLTKRYKRIAVEAASRYLSGERPTPAPIWIFWWQGETDAPDIVKRCIAAVYRNANAHPVYIIDQSNYQNFVEIPGHLLKKLEKRTISLTHFSDYYRMALLAKHGGLWIDASIYLRRPIAEFVFELPVYTIRNPGMDSLNISDWEWTVGVFGGWKDNALFHAAEELLNQYWKDFDFPLDYYIFDYMVRLVHDNCPSVRSDIQAIPRNNSDFYYLQNNANCPAEQDTTQIQSECDTWLFKLSWKGVYKLKTSDGKETVYAQWLKESGKNSREEHRN